MDKRSGTIDFSLRLLSFFQFVSVIYIKMKIKEVLEKVLIFHKITALQVIEKSLHNINVKKIWL
jgi:hypothetical protein